MSFPEERDLARWGREARAWLTHDERGRTIGLVVLSLTISIAMSLLATAIVGFVVRRRAAAPVDAVPPDVGEPTAEADAVQVRGTEVSIAEDGAAQAAGA